jgi:hypothetical protein
VEQVGGGGVGKEGEEGREEGEEGNVHGGREEDSSESKSERVREMSRPRGGIGDDEARGVR